MRRDQFAEQDKFERKEGKKGREEGESRKGTKEGKQEGATPLILNVL